MQEISNCNLKQLKEIMAFLDEWLSLCAGIFFPFLTQMACNHIEYN